MNAMDGPTLMKLWPQCSPATRRELRNRLLIHVHQTVRDLVERNTHRLPAGETIDDAVSEIMEKRILIRLDHYNPRRSSLKSYIEQQALYAIGTIRRNHQRRPLPVTETDLIRPQHQDGGEHAEDKSLANHLSGREPDPQREAAKDLAWEELRGMLTPEEFIVIEGKYREGRTNWDLAHQLRLPRQAVSGLHQAALEKLRRGDPTRLGRVLRDAI